MSGNGVATINGSVKDGEKSGGTGGGGEGMKEVDVRCGFGSCKPAWLQCCNSPRIILIWLSWFAFLQGFVVNGINNVNTSTVERRFQLTSYQAGLVSSAYDFSAGIFVLPVAYLGAHAHQPRLLAAAAFIMALGSFTMALPHFTTPLYDIGINEAEACSFAGNTTALCRAADSSLSMYLGVLMLGQFLHGIGGTTLYSLGIVYLDSNVKAKNSPIYQGILLALSTLGPALGYLLGGQFLNIYVDFDQVDTSSVGITPEDPRWVGAWWLGFLAAGTLLLTIVPLIAPYPKELPSAASAKADKASQVHKGGKDDEACREDFGKSVKDIPVACRLLLTNSVFICVTLATVSELSLATGTATFLPKFIQNQYTVTASWSALLAGFLTVPGAAGGNFLGGLIMKLMKLKVRGMLRLAILMTSLCIALMPVFLARCPDTDFAGVTVDYMNRSHVIQPVNVNVSAQCNEHCHCMTDSYEPICGSNNMQYFSPCHAGCGNSTTFHDGTKWFGDCECIESFYDGDSSTVSSEATSGPCSKGCWQKDLFLPIFFFIIFFTFMAAVPAISVTLRCVAEKQRSFAVGVQWVFVRFLGTVPGPVLFGFVFDRACLVWQGGCENSQGSCWVYDNDKLSLNMLLLGLCLKVVSLVFFCLTYIAYKPPTDSTANKSTDSFGLSSPSGRQGIDNPAHEFDDVSYDGSAHPAGRSSLTL